MQSRRQGAWAAALTVVLLAIAACGGDDGEGEATGASRDRDGGGGSSPPAGAEGYDCPAVDTEVEGDLPVEVVDAGICSFTIGSQSHHASYGLVVENTGTEPLIDVEVRVEADTAEGRAELRPMGDSIDVLPVGRHVGIGHGVTLEEPLEIETLVVQVDDPSQDDDEELPIGQILISDESTTVGDDGERTNGFATNLTADEALEDVAVYMIYRNAGGQIVGGSLDEIGRLEPGVPAEQSFTDTYGNPDATTVEVYADAPILPPGGGAAGDELQGFCDALAGAGADASLIRYTLRQGGPAATQLLEQLAGITPPPDITDAWNSMMAGGGRPTQAVNDPLRQAVDDVSRYVLDNCGIPGLP